MLSLSDCTCINLPNLIGTNRNKLYTNQINKKKLKVKTWNCEKKEKVQNLTARWRARNHTGSREIVKPPADWSRPAERRSLVTPEGYYT